jgi:hypothetical protein
MIDERYAIHNSTTTKVAVYEGSRQKLGAQLWQSDNAVLSHGGDKLWTVNLTAPRNEQQEWDLTAFAYFMENGTWQYFNDSYRGPGFADIAIKVANLATLQIELGTPGLNVQVDNSSGTTTSNGVWTLSVPVGVSHEITVPQSQQYENGTRLVFAGWQDKNNDTKRSVTLDGDTKIRAYYRTQYLLRVNSIVSEYTRSTWYDPGTNVTLQVDNSFPMPSLLGSIGMRYAFKGWSGDVQSHATTLNLTMTKPTTEDANFAVDFATLIIPMILIVGIVGGIALGLGMRRMRGKMGTTENAQVTERFCDRCGEPVEKDWDYCTHCGRDLRLPEAVQGGEGHVPDLGDEVVSDDHKKSD